MTVPRGWILGAVGLGLTCGVVPGLGTAIAPKVSAWATGINAGLLAATFVAILWYSIESHGMRSEMIRQNELAVRPLLIASIDPFERPEKLVLRNVGKGPALFVRVRELRFGEGVLAAFEVADIIEAGTSIPVNKASIRLATGDVIPDSAAVISTLKPSAPASRDLVTDYEDLNGNKRSRARRAWVRAESGCFGTNRHNRDDRRHLRGQEHC